MTLPSGASATILALLCIAGSWLDVRHRRLPNWLCLLALAVGLLLAAVAGGLAALGSHALHAALALAVGFVVFRFGMIGGGDAKFYAALASWFGLGEAFRLLMTVSISGLVMVLAWIAWRRARRIPLRRSPEGTAHMFPYGLAIAAGAMLTVLSARTF